MPALPRTRKRSKKNVPIQRWIGFFFKLILSPIVILCDSLRKRGTVDNSWVFSYLLFFTLVMMVTFICYIAVEIPIDKTLKMISMASNSKEILAGEMHPVINAINKYSLEENIDPNLIFAIIKSESNFKVGAVSPAGAMGLMQLMPVVWKEYSGSVCLGRHDSNQICSENCIFNPGENIRVGVKYFRYLLDKYNGRVDLALEAYDAGILNVNLESEPRYAETRNYTKKVTSYWSDLRKRSIANQLNSSMNIKKYLRWMFVTTFILWIIFFYWANRKLFTSSS